MRHIPLLVGILTTATLFTACGEGGTTDPNGNGTTQPQVASVEVTPGADTLHSFGHTVTLVPVAKDAQGNILTGQSFTWTSSDENVALVTSSGVVTANFMNGTATITATTGGVPGSSTILVEQVVASVTGRTGPGSMAWGLDSLPWNVLNHATTFAASARDSLDNFINRSDFSWASSDSTVVTFSGGRPPLLRFGVGRVWGRRRQHYHGDDRRRAGLGGRGGVRRDVTSVGFRDWSLHRSRLLWCGDRLDGSDRD